MPRNGNLKAVTIQGYLPLPQQKWILKSKYKNCYNCDIKLKSLKSKYNCRSCGRVVCGQCCRSLVNTKYRVCDTCISLPQAKWRLHYDIIDKIKRILTKYAMAITFMTAITAFCYSYDIDCYQIFILSILSMKHFVTQCVIVIANVIVNSTKAIFNYLIFHLLWDCIDYFGALWLLLKIVFFQIIDLLIYFHIIIENVFHSLIFEIITIKWIVYLMYFMILVCLITWMICRYQQQMQLQSQVHNFTPQLQPSRNNNKKKKNNNNNKNSNYALSMLNPFSNFNSNNNNNNMNCQWLWLDDNGKYQIYSNNQINQQIETLQINQTLNVTIGRWNYVITKLSNTTAKQVNQSTNKTRNIIRNNNNNNNNNIQSYKFKNNKKYVFGYNFENNSQLFVLNKNELTNYETNFVSKIENQFKSTLGYNKIIKIQKCRFSNLLYATYKSIISNKCMHYGENNESNLERFLWHGTSYQNIEHIIKTGFDRSYCKTYAYGKGIYFGATAACSHGYTKPHSGYRYLMYCQVFVGKMTLGCGSYETMPKDHNGYEYDSLVNSISSPYIFVISRDYHAVPLFVVKYH